MKKEKLGWKRMSDYMDAAYENTVICSCGHRIVISNKQKKLVCNHCGKLNFLDKKEQFKHDMLLKLEEK